MIPNGKLRLFTYHAYCSVLRCIATYSTYDLFDVKDVSDLEKCMDYLPLPERSCGYLNFWVEKDWKRGIGSRF